MKRSFWKKDASNSSTVKTITVKKATKDALVRYEKTLRDLAAYDRGENVSVS